MLTSADLSVLLALTVFSVVILVQQWQRSKPTTGTAPTIAEERKVRTDDNDLNKDRRPGEWAPAAFIYPPIPPVEESLDQIAPRPYRPYKPGRYHVTMGVRPMEWDSWIELDRDFPAYYRLRAARLAERGSKLLRVASSATAAARELVQELAAFLVARYPDVYRVVRRDVDGTPAALEIVPVGVTHDLQNGNPMKVAAMLTQDDLAIMIEGTDGKYYLQGGAVLLAGTWRLEDKMGLPLDAIHTTGHVPQYEEKLQPSLTRFFWRMTPHTPVVRNNWALQVLPPTPSPAHGPAPLEELAWVGGTYGAEDLLHTGARPAPPDPLPQRMRLRVERQTLRRLPRTGAIVFTIRVYLTPLDALGAGEVGRLASALRGVREQESVYRHRRQQDYEDAALAWLDARHREEVALGEAQDAA